MSTIRSERNQKRTLCNVALWLLNAPHTETRTYAFRVRRAHDIGSPSLDTYTPKTGNTTRHCANHSNSVLSFSGRRCIVRCGLPLTTLERRGLRDGVYLAVSLQKPHRPWGQVFRPEGNPGHSSRRGWGGCELQGFSQASHLRERFFLCKR